MSDDAAEVEPQPITDAEWSALKVKFVTGDWDTIADFVRAHPELPSSAAVRISHEKWRAAREEHFEELERLTITRFRSRLATVRSKAAVRVFDSMVDAIVAVQDRVKRDAESDLSPMDAAPKGKRIARPQESLVIALSETFEKISGLKLGTPDEGATKGESDESMGRWASVFDAAAKVADREGGAFIEAEVVSIEDATANGTNGAHAHANGNGSH